MRSRSRMMGVALAVLAASAIVPLYSAQAQPDPHGEPPPVELRVIRPVRVINGDDAPVPVNGTIEVDGTTDVAVTNTPAVNVTNRPEVTLGNTPDVSVANTPDVRVANTPTVHVDGNVGVSGSVDASQAGPWTVGLDPDDNRVEVANASSDPLPVRDVDSGALEPFAAEMSGVLDLCTMVPDDKRLVIEWVTWSASQDAADTVFVRPALVAVTGGTKVEHMLSFTTQVSPFSGSPDKQWHIASHATHVYADPGTDVCVQGVSLSGGLGSQQASISGHLVDVG